MGEFPTLYQQWRRKAIAANYPRCTRCNEPIQKEYQRKGRLCRQCTDRERSRSGEPEGVVSWADASIYGVDAVKYERGE
jgi:hypothetical protein